MKTGGNWKDTSGQEATVTPRTSRDDVSWLAAIGAEVGLSSAATLFVGKGTTIAGTQAIQIHGDVGLGGGVGAGSRGKELRRRLVGEAGRLRLWLASEVVCSCLVLFDGDGSGNVGVEKGRDRAPGGELKADRLPNFLRQDINQGVVCPPGGKGVCYVLKSNC